MRLAFASILFLAVGVRCELHFRFTTDLLGKYVPFDENGTDCHQVVPSSDLLGLQQYLPEKLQIIADNFDDNFDDTDEDEKEQTGDVERWPLNCNGGVSRHAQLLQRNHLKENVSYVTVSGGNVLSTGEWEVLVRYEAAAQAASVYDVIGLGPEEFRRGVDFLSDYLRDIGDTHVLACNLEADQLAHIVKPSVLLNATCNGSGCGNHKVGVVGFVGPDNVLDELGYSDPSIRFSNLSCVHEQVENLTAKGAETVVAVGSVSSLNSLTETGLLDIGLHAIVVSGLSDEDKASLANSRLISGSSTHVLATDSFGVIMGDFNSDDNSSTMIAINDTVKDDPLVLQNITSLQAEVDAFYGKQVHVLHTLNGVECGSRECSLADLLTDAMLVGVFYRHLVGDNRSDHPNPIAIWPGSYWSGSIPKGLMNVGELHDLLPRTESGNSTQVALGTASGDVVTALFARSVAVMSRDFTYSETFLQVSGARVTYDLDLAPEFRAKYLMNLCFSCSPQQYLAVSPHLNYTIVLPAMMLAVNSSWLDITSRFYSHEIADFDVRDIVTSLANAAGFLRAPVGERIEFTHLDPDWIGSSDTFITVIVTIVVCMFVFGLSLLGFRAWSRRQHRNGSTMALMR